MSYLVVFFLLSFGEAAFLAAVVVVLFLLALGEVPNVAGLRCFANLLPLSEAAFRFVIVPLFLFAFGEVALMVFFVFHDSPPIQGVRQDGASLA
jgi:hypothetical protein